VFGPDSSYCDKFAGLGVLNDMQVLDLVHTAWKDLSGAILGTAPSPRLAHGFAMAEDKLYVHGGWIPHCRIPVYDDSDHSLHHSNQQRRQCILKALQTRTSKLLPGQIT